jgi:hypothetical protein
MPNLIAHLSPAGQRELLDDLNYLNLAELRGFCREHAIPHRICVETGPGERKRTKDTDRKSVVLDRVRRYLTTGRVPAETCFGAHVVCSDKPPARLKQTDRLYYGWYDKTSEDMLSLLSRLTAGRFRNGAIARILAREFWTDGKAPTFAEYAEAWLEAERKGLGVAEGRHPEAAWLTDRARGEAGSDWKARRQRKAKQVLEKLRALRAS